MVIYQLVQLDDNRIFYQFVKPGVKLMPQDFYDFCVDVSVGGGGICKVDFFLVFVEVGRPGNFFDIDHAEGPISFR